MRHEVVEQENERPDVRPEGSMPAEENRDHRRTRRSKSSLGVAVNLRSRSYRLGLRRGPELSTTNTMSRSTAAERVIQPLLLALATACVAMPASGQQPLSFDSVAALT